MSTSGASWKYYAAGTVATPPVMPLLSSKISFAVDASGSTAGRVMEREKEFVLGMVNDYSFPSSVIMWGSSVMPPVSAQATTWKHRNWGTSPEVIFHDAAVTSEVKSCDMWYLLTDGEVGSPVNFARKTLEVGMANTPVVFLIVNSFGAKPSTIDISVGISVFASASDAAIVYKNISNGELYLLAAKGAFEVLSAGFDIDLEKWESLPLFPDEVAFKTALKDVNIVGVAHRASSAAVNLGRSWQEKHGCLVDIDILLAQMIPQSIPQDEFLDLLEEETFDALALLCKTRGLLPTLRNWLLARKERVSVIEIRDVSGAADILQQLRVKGDGTQAAAGAEALRHRLRAAHQSNLQDYRSRLANIQPSPLLPHINRCLAFLTALEKAGYAADILDRRSNRAMRAAVVTSSDVDQQLAALNLDDDVEAHRSTCSICCSDDVIMSLALKVSANPGDNTTDFALNFPLAAGVTLHNRDVISAQYVCFQCALAMYQMDPARGSMYNEPIAAVLPLAKYDGVNRKYITDCLATVLTNGLATGASGLTQVLMSIILTTMKTKEWAKATDADREIKARREGMQWMLNNLVANASCRETFDETGDWVSFDRALRWTLKTFTDEGIYSWTVRYPVPGFLVLLELLTSIGAQIPETLRVGKLMHEIVTVYMRRIVDPSADKLAVQRRILKIVFAEFNAEGVPRDLKNNDLAINSPDVAFERLAAWLDVPGTTVLIKQIGQIGGAAKYASALQYVAFRLFFEDSHQTPKGYFQRAAESDVHLHTATTKPQDLTSAVVGPLFTAMWGRVPAELSHQDVTQDTIAPFVSPYSASVLHCGFRGCPVRFDGDGYDPEAIRKARAVHLAQVYALKDAVPKAGNGLPENTGRLEAPTTTHITLHASIYKTWRSLEKDRRQSGLKEVVSGAPVDAAKPHMKEFIDAVVDHICITSARGNIYKKNLRDEVAWVLPSFFTALHAAAAMKQLTDDADLELVENSLTARIQWELELLKM
ncbi:hypothetical protein DFH07DRAFT_913026 [Mycena maculata]|uniref:Uncharacterized protein n=1 Tax=Mycena maculata TaxID=230809 RepID=A0AAD7JXC3_9AGAR|nr:hypothetical protein DFH07DRAFT_913026 [Mycena maculata]